MTKVKKCTCKHEYQDNRYGKGYRLHNELSSKNQYSWRCTVCGKESH